jgi:peptide/nickel transport system permease protein
MLTYLLRRILLIVPTLLGITLVVFTVMAASPGGIGAQSLTQGVMQPEARKAMEEYYNRRYGLDASAPEQYLRWLNSISPIGFETVTDASGQFGYGNFSLLKGSDLGDSFLYGRSVSGLIAERLPVTLLLNLLSIPVVYIIAIAIGVRAATQRGQSFDVMSGTVLLALWSVPVMLAGILLIGFFASEQNWFWFPESGLNRRVAEDMPFLPHLSGFTDVLLVFAGVALAVSVSLFANARLPDWWRSLVFGGVGLVAGFAMADSIGQPITSLAHFLISLSVAVLCWLIAASDFKAMRVLFCGAAGIVAGILLVRGFLHGDFVRGFLFDRLWHLALPVLCLSFGGFAFLAKLSRSSILENMAADYARTARAKGATDDIVLWRHVFRNSLIPLITVAASLLPGLLAGSVIVESLFSIEGMGKLAVEAVKGRDRELVLSLTLISGVLTLIGYLLADICYALVDPRVSYE